MSIDLGKLSLHVPQAHDAMPKVVVLAGGIYVSAGGDVDEPLVVETPSVELNGKLYTRRQDSSDVVVDLRARRVHVGDAEVVLSRKEFDLLVAMAAEPDRCWSGVELLRQVWNYSNAEMVITRTVESHMSRIRRKLGALGIEACENVWGVGYRLGVPVEVRT